MSRLADYFVIVGYDHEKERKYYWTLEMTQPEMNVPSAKALCN